LFGYGERIATNYSNRVFAWDREEEFMKLYRNMIILVVVLLVLGGSLLAVKLLLKDDDPTSYDDDSIITLYNYDSKLLTELIIESDEGKFVFKKREGTEEYNAEWDMVSGGNFPIHNQNVNIVSLNAVDLKAYKLIEENPSSLELYGLDKPYRVTFKLSDGTEKYIDVGSMTPTKQGYYIRISDSNNVYAIYSYKGDLLVATKDEIRNRVIFDVSSEEVIKFSLDRDGKKVFAAEKSKETGWKILEPIKSDANLVKLTTIFDYFVRASAETYIEENAQDLAQYGLDNPRYVIEAATADTHVKVLLGKNTEGSSLFYARLDGSNEVFTIDKSSLSFIDLKPIEVIDTLVYAPFIYDVSEVVVNIDGKTIVAQIESDSAKPEEDKFTIDGYDVMSKGSEGVDAFRNFYRSLVGIYCVDLELLDEKPTGTPEVTITYTLEKEPGKIVLELVPKDDKKYYVLENGEYYGKVVNKSILDEGDGVRKNYAKLMEIVK